MTKHYPTHETVAEVDLSVYLTVPEGSEKVYVFGNSTKSGSSLLEDAVKDSNGFVRGFRKLDRRSEHIMIHAKVPMYTQLVAEVPTDIKSLIDDLKATDNPETIRDLKNKLNAYFNIY